jgi:hypothetical protein
VIQRALRKAQLLVLLAVVSAASADVSAPPPADWIEVTADGKFSIMAPRGTTFSRTSGIDSFTGVFNAPGFAIYADYGAHTNPLERDRNNTAYVERTLDVHGKPGKLVAARTRAGDRSYFIGMHIANVGRSVVGMTGLTLTCNLEREQDLAIVETVYSSVQFK